MLFRTAAAPILVGVTLAAGAGTALPAAAQAAPLPPQRAPVSTHIKGWPTLMTSVTTNHAARSITVTPGAHREVDLQAYY